MLIAIPNDSTVVFAPTHFSYLYRVYTCSFDNQVPNHE